MRGPEHSTPAAALRREGAGALYRERLQLHTRGRGVHELTRTLQQLVGRSGIRDGLCVLNLLHTSASLMICENADPQVLADLEAFLSRLVPDGDPLFGHVAEGPDDMPAHVRSVLTQLSLSLPVQDGACLLGTWQGVYLWEHRTRGHRRELVVSVQGTPAA